MKKEGSGGRSGGSLALHEGCQRRGGEVLYCTVMTTFVSISEA